jgi:hypothetical protein
MDIESLQLSGRTIITSAYKFDGACAENLRPVPEKRASHLYGIYIFPRRGSAGAYTEPARHWRLRRRRNMLDLAFLAAGTGFFLLAIAYVAACARL